MRVKHVVTSWILPIVGALNLVAAGIFLAQAALPQLRAQAQARAALVNEVPRTITVVGEGTVKIKPDIAQVDIGVTVKNGTVREASDEAEKIMDAVMKALRGHEIAEGDIQTSGFSIWADEPYAGPEGRSQGEVIYRVSNQVKVTIRDLDKVAAVLGSAIEAGANSIYGVSFSIDDPTQMESGARKEAAADALAKAKELAVLHKANVGDLISISEVVGDGGGHYAGGFETMRGLGGGGGGPISPGELELSRHLQVVYALE